MGHPTYHPRSIMQLSGYTQSHTAQSPLQLSLPQSICLQGKYPDKQSVVNYIVARLMLSNGPSESCSVGALVLGLKDIGKTNWMGNITLGPFSPNSEHL